MSSYYIDSSADGGLPPTIPPPEWIPEVACYTPEMNNNVRFLLENYVGALDVVKAVCIGVTAVLAVLVNVSFIVVLNAPSYAKRVWVQPRIVLTVMSVNDLLFGVFVLAVGVYPALFECWPLGKFVCQFQALIRGCLSQNSALVLITLALERYVCTMHPFSYRSVCDKKILILILLASFGASAAFYSAVVLQDTGFHFNIRGLMICEPYYLANDALILASCIFYFPTTMALMYCYGTIFHSTKAKSKYRNVIFNTLPFLAGQTAASGIDKFMIQRKRNELTSRSCAAVSLAFIILVTPWAIQLVITSVTRTKSPMAVDFLVSWVAASHSVWSPTIYWMLNPKFRRAGKRFFIKYILCRPLPLTWHMKGCDKCSEGRLEANEEAAREDGVMERHWGEILERSFSNHDLHDKSVSMQGDSQSDGIKAENGGVTFTIGEKQ